MGYKSRRAAAEHRTDMSNAAEILKSLETKITKDMVKKVKGIFAFEIAGETWVADLKKEGKLHKGKPAGLKPDCTMIMTEAVFIELFTGKMNPQKGFMQGKYKIKGNIMASQKLQALMK